MKIVEIEIQISFGTLTKNMNGILEEEMREKSYSPTTPGDLESSEQWQNIEDDGDLAAIRKRGGTGREAARWIEQAHGDFLWIFLEIVLEIFKELKEMSWEQLEEEEGDWMGSDDNGEVGKRK